jgi:hypothetical protein
MSVVVLICPGPGVVTMQGFSMNQQVFFSGAGGIEVNG